VGLNIVVIMAGGSGSRLRNPEKHLLKIGDKTIIEYLIETLKNIFKSIVVLTSVRHRRLIELLRKYEYVDIIVMSGVDYCIDMCMCINTIIRKPILIVNGDCVIINFEKFIKALEYALKISNYNIVTLCYVDGSVSNVSLVYADRCIFGKELSWTSLPIFDLNDIIDIDTLDDYVKVVSLFSKSL